MQRTHLLGELITYRSQSSFAHRQPILLLVTPHHLSRKYPCRLDVALRRQLLYCLLRFPRRNVDL